MFKLEKVCDRIYKWEFDNSYDMTMHCLRVSEFRESTEDAFHGKAFNIIDYIDWYMRKASSDGTWSYPDDWSGFNIEAKDFRNTYEANKPSDWNRFDHIAYGIYKYLYSKEGSDDFYVIATVVDDLDTFDHEFAHALFIVDKSYKKEMLEIIEALPPGALKRIKSILKKELLYRPKVHLDELQAYFATDLPNEIPTSYEKYRAPFIKVFEKYKRKHLTD